ncbi:MAG: DUF177 domain-containing protein [Pyrinomonadaceae bacterium]
MIIELASLGTKAKQIDVEFDPADIDLEGEFVHVGGKTHLGGEIELIENKAHLRGTIKASLLLGCTRCLEPIERDVEFTFRDIFVDANAETTDDETELADEALDESQVENGQIDVAEMVREQLLLWLPEQIFCREDCRGLCPKCGGNLNLIDCKCDEEEVDPRWAALKSLK